MPDRALPESPPSPDAGTPPDDWDETLLRAIDAGKLDPSQPADARLASAFAAHQKLEPLFAALRGEPADLCRERTLPARRDSTHPPPDQLGRYHVRSGTYCMTMYSRSCSRPIL